MSIEMIAYIEGERDKLNPEEKSVFDSLWETVNLYNLDWEVFNTVQFYYPELCYNFLAALRIAMREWDING